MIDIILDTLLDSLHILPFLFLSFLLIELFEHKLSEASEKMVKKSGKFGSIVGSLLGAIPQCGFASIATNLYVTRIITLGTLVSIYLSTSDELIPIMISSNAPMNKILSIVLIKVIIGMVVGICIDIMYQKKRKHADYHVCDEESCDCEHGILKSTLIHTIKTLLLIMVISFILNIVMSFVSEDVIGAFMMKHKILAPVLAALIGLIPNCGASVVISELYINNIISLGTTLAGLLPNAGVSLIILFKENKNLKENLGIIFLIVSIGILFGIIFNFMNLTI